MNRKTVGALTAVAAVAVSLFVASPAHAATVDIGDSCTTADDSEFDVTAAPGETITLVHSTDCLANTAVVMPAGAPIRVVDDYEYVVGSDAQPGSQAVIIVGKSVDFSYIRINVTFSGGAVTPAGSVPADIVQQVGMPATGCTNLRVPHADWSGVASGGWGQSWAWWVNGGTGGPVCTRTLGYSTGLGGWFVRS